MSINTEQFNNFYEETRKWKSFITFPEHELTSSFYADAILNHPYENKKPDLWKGYQSALDKSGESYIGKLFKVGFNLQNYEDLLSKRHPAPIALYRGAALRYYLETGNLFGPRPILYQNMKSTHGATVDTLIKNFGKTHIGVHIDINAFDEKLNDLVLISKLKLAYEQFKSNIKVLHKNGRLENLHPMETAFLIYNHNYSFLDHLKKNKHKHPELYKERELNNVYISKKIRENLSTIFESYSWWRSLKPNVEIFEFDAGQLSNVNFISGIMLPLNDDTSFELPSL